MSLIVDRPSRQATMLVAGAFNGFLACFNYLYLLFTSSFSVICKILFHPDLFSIKTYLKSYDEQEDIYSKR